MAEPRRVLSIAHSYAASANRRLPHAMAEVGGGRWEIVAAAPDLFHGSRDLRTQRLDTRDEPALARIEPVGARWTSRVHLFRYDGRLRDLLRQRWDLVHAWEEPYIVAGGQIARWCPPGARLAFRTAQSLPKRYPPPFGWIERRAMRRADGWICSGALVEGNLAARRGYADKPHARIPLGVDLDRFVRDAAAGAELRARLGWAAGDAVVGYLGRFVPEKGLDLLMAALRGCRAPWRLMLVGGGPMEPALRAFAAAHPGRVAVLTGVEHGEVPRHLSAMDLLCAPSRTSPRWKEQFGRMIVEAFACGVPVLGSDSGEIPFVIGDSGEVVGEADLAGWTAAIERLLGDPRRRADLAARGRARAPEYDWRRVARRHLEFFDRLLA